MSADWFYIKSGGFFSRKKRVGPITEQRLLMRIESGEIKPDTLMSSQEKTHGHWVEMKTIKPAIRHWRTHHPDVA